MLTNEQFQKKLKQDNPSISTNTIYKGNKTLMDCTCQYNHKFTTKAFNLIYNKTGCPVCSGLLVSVGYNDMWTTNPELASLLANPEDGYKYKQYSDKKVNWRCPSCNEILFKRISTVRQHGLVCNKCSDGVSFPNRFMYNMLAQLNIEFITEYIIDGAKYRYDFYLPKFNTIIEMQGKQHYEGWNNKGITKEEIQKNDKLKKDFAIKNGITLYVDINSSESNKTYISQSILNSELKTIFDLSKINWDKCLLDSAKSFIGMAAQLFNKGLSITEISKKLKVSNTSIYRWLKIATELKLCNWVPSTGFLNDEKPVILLNTLVRYKSISDASKKNNVSVQCISDNCNHITDYAGLDADSKPLVWIYENEYNKDKQYDIEHVYLNHKTGIGVNKYTLDGIYVRTYNSIAHAKKSSNISTIINVCSKKKFDAGGFRWYYIDDMMQPDKTKIVGNPRYYGDDKEYDKKTLKHKERINNKYNDIVIDVYDRYGQFLNTYIGYEEAFKNTNCTKEQIYSCCSGKNKITKGYVFRYNGEDFFKYFNKNDFRYYINVYTKDNMEFVGTYYSSEEVGKKLKVDSRTVRNILSNKRNNTYKYHFYYCLDKNQPDKSKIIFKEKKDDIQFYSYY